MSRFFNSELNGIVPYTPGEQPRDMKYVKLNTNESPFPPSKKIIAKVTEEAEKLNLYPDPTAKELTERLAENLGVNTDEVILGNGSDEILYFAFSAFCNKSVKAVFPNITYGFYKVFAEICNIPYEELPLENDFTIDITKYFNANKTVFIANPNAPTGIALTVSEIEQIVKNNLNNVVVVDEAYVDFGAETCVPLIKKYNNLLVVQTFSKSRSMAGARLGMGIASNELIKDLNTVKYSINPYNINRMTMATGIAVLEDEFYTKECCNTIIKNREYLENELLKLGFTFNKSCANFVFAKHNKVGGEAIYKLLKEKGVLVRHFDTPLLTDYNRITVGTVEQINILISKLGEILEELK